MSLIPGSSGALSGPLGALFVVWADTRNHVEAQIYAPSVYKEQINYFSSDTNDYRGTLDEQGMENFSDNSYLPPNPHFSKQTNSNSLDRKLSERTVKYCGRILGCCLLQ